MRRATFDWGLKIPILVQEWEKLAEAFQSKLQFPHAVGAIVRKHINICVPPNSGSEYFNYKKQFSIVLLAITDADTKCIPFDLGAAGSQSDGGIFKHGSLGKICKSEDFPHESKLGKEFLTFLIFYWEMKPLH